MAVVVIDEYPIIRNNQLPASNSHPCVGARVHGCMHMYVSTRMCIHGTTDEPEVEVMVRTLHVSLLHGAYMRRAIDIFDKYV